MASLAKQIDKYFLRLVKGRRKFIEKHLWRRDEIGTSATLQLICWQLNQAGKLLSSWLSD